MGTRKYFDETIVLDDKSTAPNMGLWQVGADGSIWTLGILLYFCFGGRKPIVHLQVIEHQ
jgi:hypothetical protein